MLLTSLYGGCARPWKARALAALIGARQFPFYRKQWNGKIVNQSGRLQDNKNSHTSISTNDASALTEKKIAHWRWRITKLQLTPALSTTAKQRGKKQKKKSQTENRRKLQPFELSPTTPHHTTGDAKRERVP